MINFVFKKNKIIAGLLRKLAMTVSVEAALLYRLKKKTIRRSRTNRENNFTLNKALHFFVDKIYLILKGK